MTSPPRPSRCVCHEPHCTQGGHLVRKWPGQGGTPVPVQSTLPLVMAVHQAQSGIEQVTSRGCSPGGQLENRVEAQHLGHPRGEEGGMKKQKEVRKGKSGAPPC